MGAPVPASDLPSGLVPASDMPEDAGAPKTAPSHVPASPRGILRSALHSARYALPVVGPAEAMRDASDAADKLAYRAGEGATDVATGLGASPQTAAKFGVGANMAVGAIPAFVGGEAGKLASPQVANLGRRLMSSALKPDKFARESGDAGRAIQTLLDKGFNVTEGGVQKMTAMIDELDAQLTQAIANSPAKVSTISIVKPVKDALDRFRYGLDHATDAKAIKAEMLKFFDHPEVQQAFQIPVQTAQAIKRGIYRELGDKAYGIGLKSDAQREGKKAVALGLREGIERAEPSAAGINKEMGDLVNARDITQNRVLVAGNKNPVGLGWLNPREMIPWMLDRSELAKSLAARGLYSGREAIPASAGRALGATEGAYEETRPRK